MRRSHVILGSVLTAVTLAVVSLKIKKDILENQIPEPINKTMHHGNVNGVKIEIPKKYWASVELTPKEVSPFCRLDIAIDEQYRCPISSIRLSLRRSTFTPIYTHGDLMDWWSNFMLPYEKTSPAHRWIEIGIDAKFFSEIHGDLEGVYTSLLSDATKKFGELRCDLKFDLSHCVTDKEDGLLSPNEFYFDKNTGLTLIKCTKLTGNYGVYYSCEQYFLIPEMLAVVRTGGSSIEEVSQWKLLNDATKKIALSLISTN